MFQQAAINLSLYAHKFERQRCFKILGCISMIHFSIAIDSLNTAPLPINRNLSDLPKRYSESDLIQKRYLRFLLSGNGSPLRSGNLGTFGSGYPVRNRSIAYNTEYTGNSYSFIIGLGQCVDVEAGSGKAVGSAIRTGQKAQSSYRFPVFAKCQLLVVSRRVGHNLVFLTMIYREFPTDIFKNGTVTCSIRNR